jgi:hypothetical protein
MLGPGRQSPGPSAADCFTRVPSDPPIPGRLDILEGTTAPAPPAGARPWLGVFFVCSNRYVRVTRHPSSQSCTARCPSCGKSITFRVGPGGTTQKLFEVSC